MTPSAIEASDRERPTMFLLECVESCLTRRHLVANAVEHLLAEHA